MVRETEAQRRRVTCAQGHTVGQRQRQNASLLFRTEVAVKRRWCGMPTYPR